MAINIINQFHSVSNYAVSRYSVSNVKVFVTLDRPDIHDPTPTASASTSVLARSVLPLTGTSTTLEVGTPDASAVFSSSTNSPPPPKDASSSSSSSSTASSTSAPAARNCACAVSVTARFCPVASALTSACSWVVCAVVRRVRTRYSESVRSGQRDGSVERVVCGSKEVACEARRCAAAVSVVVGSGVGGGACGGGGSAAANGG
jgi:hypothetical protein